MAKFVKIAIHAEFAGFVKIAASSVPLSRAQSLFGEISSKSPFSPDSSKSPLCRYPYLELNRSSRKFRQNRHSLRIRRIRQNRRFVGTPISSSIALRRNSSKSPFSPNSPDLSKSALRRYPYLELNRSSGKFRQNRHSLRIRRIRQNRRFVGTPISSSIALRRNSSKSPFSPNSPDLSKSALRRYPYLRAQSLFGEISSKSPNSSELKFVKIAKFAGFVKIAALSVPLSRAQSIFGKISSKSPFSPNSPDSSKSSLRRYPYLELNRSLAKFRQNRQIRQN